MIASLRTLVACATLVTAAVANAQTSDAHPFDAQTLMRTLAANRSNRADFVERKYLSSLDRPLESSGELVYRAPSHFEKRTLAPKPETLVVDGDTLSIERNGTTRTISLASYPEVAAFTDSIRATLAGDLAALTRNYRVTVDGSPQRWRLVLLPSDARIATVVSRVTVNGHDDRIDAFEVLQADGNRSVTTLAPHAGA